MSESDSLKDYAPLLMMTKVMLFLFSKLPGLSRRGAEVARVTKKQNPKHRECNVSGDEKRVQSKDE